MSLSSYLRWLLHILLLYCYSIRSKAQLKSIFFFSNALTFSYFLTPIMCKEMCASGLLCLCKSLINSSQKSGDTSLSWSQACYWLVGGVFFIFSDKPRLLFEICHCESNFRIKFVMLYFHVPGKYLEINFRVNWQNTYTSFWFIVQH